MKVQVLSYMVDIAESQVPNPSKLIDFQKLFWDGMCVVVLSLESIFL